MPDETDAKFVIATFLSEVKPVLEVALGMLFPGDLQAVKSTTGKAFSNAVPAAKVVSPTFSPDDEVISAFASGTSLLADLTAVKFMIQTLF